MNASRQKDMTMTDLTREQIDDILMHGWQALPGKELEAYEKLTALCNMALGYLNVMPRPIEEAPKDGTFFYGWHRVWNCWIAVKKYENSWIEKTLCTQWPYDAFTHFIPLSSLPKVKHD